MRGFDDALCGSSQRYCCFVSPLVTSSFYLASGPTDTTLAWQRAFTANATLMTNAIAFAHSLGSVVLVSVGGETDATLLANPISLANSVVAWAKAYKHDGYVTTTCHHLSWDCAFEGRRLPTAPLLPIEGLIST